LRGPLRTIIASASPINSALPSSNPRHRCSHVSLSDLALPFAKIIAEHLKLADKQATYSSSRFLDTCRQFNRQEISEEQLAEATVRLGFNNVIDALHVVSNGEIAKFHPRGRINL
jgi:hypothetical protein